MKEANFNLVRQLRIQKASPILLDKNYNSEVAFEVGYDNPKYFTKCFKRQLGITPTEYRGFRSRDLKSFRILEKRFISSLAKVVENDLSNNFISLDVFASKMNVSKSTLYHRMKLISGLKPR